MAQPLGSGGWLLLAACGAALWWQGIGKQDLVVLMATVCLAGLILLLALITGIAALALRRTLLRRSEGPFDRLDLEAESWQPTDFEVRLSAWIPFLEVDWEWKNLPAEVRSEWRRGRGQEMVRPRRRGILAEVERSLWVGDVFRLTSVTMHFRSQREVVVLPGMGAIDRLTLLRRFVSGEDLSDPHGDPTGDRVDMRQYTRGDSPRTILWKVFARTRRLMVRVPERAVTARPRACAYLVAGPGDEAAAGMARVVLQRGLLGDGWRFGADGTPGHTADPEEALLRLARSGSAGTEPSGLAGFLREAAREGFACCFIFVPTEPGLKEGQVLEALHASPMRHILCLGLDRLRLDRTDRQIRWSRLLFRTGEGGATRADVERVAEQWRGAGCELFLVDRVGGGIYPDVDAVLRAWGSAS